MKKDNVLEAMTEARRFIDRCEEYLDRHHSDQAFRYYVDGGLGYAETGAMRRADKKAGNNSAATVKNYLIVHQTLARGR